MISLGVHHFGKRTVWSLSYFLNNGYYDILPSLKFIKSPFIVPSVRGNLVYRVSLNTGNIEVNVQKLVTESIHYKGELDSIKFDMAGVKAEATGVNVFVTSMQKHIGVLTNNMTMYVLITYFHEYSISI